MLTILRGNPSAFRDPINSAIRNNVLLVITLVFTSKQVASGQSAVAGVFRLQGVFGMTEALYDSGAFSTFHSR